MDPFRIFFIFISFVMALMMMFSHSTKILTFLIKCSAVIILSPMVLIEVVTDKLRYWRELKVKQPYKIYTRYCYVDRGKGKELFDDKIQYWMKTLEYFWIFPYYKKLTWSSPPDRGGRRKTYYLQNNQAGIMDKYSNYIYNKRKISYEDKEMIIGNQTHPST